jgi:hypothetical protein
LADHLLKLSLRRPARRQHNPLAPSGDTIRRPPGSLGAAYSRP